MTWSAGPGPFRLRLRVPRAEDPGSAGNRRGSGPDGVLAGLQSSVTQSRQESHAGLPRTLSEGSKESQARRQDSEL